MEVGEKFVFESFRFYGRDQRLPVHPRHIVAVEVQQELMTTIVTGSAYRTVDGGMVGLIKLLKYGYSVKRYQVNGKHTKVLLIHDTHGEMFWFI
jgi:hypothetical protein